MISLSLATDHDPRHQVRFADSGPLTLPQFCDIITRNIWSPIIWNEGLRNKHRFLSAAYFVLDFDGTRPLADVIKFVRDFELAHIIGTTKSHQKEKIAKSGKISPPADRFRVVLRADGSQVNRELYEYNMGILDEAMDSDGSCADAARFFYPCKEIVAMGKGNACRWLDFDPDYVPENVRYERRKQLNKERGALGLVPQWMQRIFDDDELPEDQRHKTALRIGIELAELGWPVDRVFDRLVATKLGRYVGATELRRHLENGFKIGGGC